MGYRLAISELEQVYYGSKLFGYVHEEILKSYKYLKDIEAIKGDEQWEYGFYNPIVLSIKEFKDFRKLYAEDLEENNGKNESDWFLNETKHIIEREDYELIILNWE